MGESKEFQFWARQQALKLRGKETVEERVDRLMSPENLLIEVETEDGWHATT